MFRRLAKLFCKPPASRTLTDELETVERQHATHLLACETLDAAELLSQHPPKIEHAKKRLLFDIALARGLQGKLVVRRYQEISLPIVYEPYAPDTEIVARAGYFRYSAGEGVDEWYMNFAHHDLFHGYGHFMFAQDEIQVAEHPALASVREMMLHRTDGLRPRTVEEGSPTPVLLSGVSRNLHIDTRTIYGARFARADDATIRQCARLI